MPGKSGTRGVQYKQREKRWLARLKKDGKRIHIGSYLTKKDALIAWNKKAKEEFGEYAYQNPL